MTTRDEILEEVKKIVADSMPQDGDIFIRDLVEIGMDDSAAKKYLDAKVKANELRVAHVIVDGRGCNAYRAVS